MTRPTLAQLRERCQKPDHRRVGNWMARRVSRPAALRVTWLVAPWGVSASAATLAAWLVGVGSCAALAWGNVAGWVVAAGLLQLWYLLDHVDGQLARWHGTASLDGVQLDYLMHHTLNLLIPIAAGWGIATVRFEPGWALIGLIAGVGLLLIGLQHDTRYKAFVQRLKRVRGQLLVEGGGGGRPAPTPSVPRKPRQAASFAARKFCEPHVVMNVLSLLAITQWALHDVQLSAGRAYLAVLAAVAATVAVGTVARAHVRHDAEREFARWYRPKEGDALVFRDGWWAVESEQDRQATERSDRSSGAAVESSIDPIRAGS